MTSRTDDIYVVDGPISDKYVIGVNPNARAVSSFVSAFYLRSQLHQLMRTLNEMAWRLYSMAFVRRVN